MVSPQVDDIYRTLDDISSLKKNNWETRSQEPPPVSRRRPTITMKDGFDKLIHLPCQAESSTKEGDAISTKAK